MALITVFTPTYNRADLLVRGYEALKRQTSKDFIWLIIDDGSTDNTREVVSTWQSETNDFEIRYVYKENGGLHTGYNAAIERLDTELAVCVDSDDYLTDNAIECVSALWQKQDDQTLAGIVALDGDEKGNIIGDPFPCERINLIKLLLGKYPIRNGDRKLFIRSDLYKSVAPQKTFEGEKNFNPHYMHLQLSRGHDFLVLNEILCVVEYQTGGMSNGMFRQYYNSPKSFAETRRLYLSFEGASFSFRLKQCIHYVSSSILSKDRHFIKHSPAKLLTIAAIPFGILLSVIIKFKAKQ